MDSKLHMGRGDSVVPEKKEPLGLPAALNAFSGIESLSRASISLQFARKKHRATKHLPCGGLPVSQVPGIWNMTFKCSGFLFGGKRLLKNRLIWSKLNLPCRNSLKS
jgi:hypothetical protein